MKNLKRFLAIGLSLVMILALVDLNGSVPVKAGITSYQHQAEKATLLNGAKKETKYSGAYKRSYVMLPSGKSKAEIKFNVKVSAKSLYNVSIRYSNGSKAAKSLGVYVNKKFIKTSNLLPTSSWKKWSTKVDTLTLNKGSNTISYRSRDKDSAAVDCIKVSVTKPYVISLNDEIKYQTITGFGGFGGNSNGTFSDQAYVDALYDDLGATIFRAEIETDFEPVNDNNDSNNLDLSKYNVEGTRNWIDHFKALKAKGHSLFIATVWSPPAWMKTNNETDNGGNLKVECYQEFAEYLVAYVKVMKQEAGIDLYAINIQNEPNFVEPYQSCVYSFAQYAAVNKIVYDRFKKEGIKTLLFGPEDVQSYDRISNYVYALDDVNSINTLGIVAVHGYGFNGVDPSDDAPYNWMRTQDQLAKFYKKPLWMTETSGYYNNWPDAMKLAQDMYTSLKYGQINAWVWWRLSDNQKNDNRCEREGLMIDRQPTVKYYISKNYYRYIRPGAVQFMSKSTKKNVLVLAYRHVADKKLTIILINNGTVETKVNVGGINGTVVPSKFNAYRTSSTENCVDVGIVNSSSVTLPASSITTLQATFN